jgi:2-polyprenyl-3-methyl-5-hydroxy-6-metoxy-1,4-benzoquinol methylase
LAFYEELSKYYDTIFSKEEVTANFLKNGLSDKNRILDLACGTGTYSIEIAKDGHSVVGIDLDKTMIEKAKAKSEVENLTVSFYAEDMRKFKAIANDNLYDMIFCIGNSLVHLNNSDDILQLFRDIHGSLKEAGWMVIQIINYDRIINNNITSLPTISRNDDGVKFVRNYSRTSDKSIINFNTELIVTDEDDEKTYKNSVPLLALRSNEILELAESAGFSNYQLFGGFNSSEFNEDSYALILKCYR